METSYKILLAVARAIVALLLGVFLLISILYGLPELGGFEIGEGWMLFGVIVCAFALAWFLSGSVIRFFRAKRPNLVFGTTFRLLLIFGVVLLVIGGIAWISRRNVSQVEVPAGSIRYTGADPPSPSLPSFPWPPPKPSTSVPVPRSVLLPPGQASFGDVEDSLRNALAAAGYVEISLYAIPDGFAMVTRLEKINQDGTPSKDSRWELDVGPLRSFKLHEYLSALFYARPGFFRVIVFAVTPHAFEFDHDIVGRDEAVGWLFGGVNRLPSEMRDTPYPQKFRCDALVYEFEQTETGRMPALAIPGRLTALVHLQKAKIWQGRWDGQEVPRK